MLGETIDFKITVKEETVILNLTMRTLKNIYRLSGRSPFEFIQDFIQCDEKELNQYLIQLVLCLSDMEIPLENLVELITEENAVIMKEQLMILINHELVSEMEQRTDSSEEEEQSEPSKQKKIQNWIQWFNYLYYVARCQLNMSEESFYESTPRELKTLESLHKNFEKNILLASYVDVMKSRQDISTSKHTLNATTVKKGFSMKQLLMNHRQK
ncbi:hypothetical protein [Turicibacter sanguinis]|uniref:hypothetical protein n=2 Tax=Turicibacter sanguinis TaxID=154288 RepID=UPI00232AAF6B|nr:hypothetical protein [Turicibacter sanguinis]MDB8575606.1 hypothetical protein [Turicibacter sanguinis]MDB8578758.1 hypothetical protein [Turicibacter sanguinis]MDB8584081.1 hypothetical protein [Turicibacter sanguinis]MDB8588006.1 hypothetical protein [Turicibacter sanguinis]MDB8598148.1 hypothetical protein [Turicibacter sanguinis]